MRIAVTGHPLSTCWDSVTLPSSCFLLSPPLFGPFDTCTCVEKTESFKSKILCVSDSKARIKTESFTYTCDSLHFRQANTSGYHTMLILLLVLKRVSKQKEKRKWWVGKWYWQSSLPPQLYTALVSQPKEEETLSQSPCLSHGRIHGSPSADYGPRKYP